METSVTEIRSQINWIVQIQIIFHIRFELITTSVKVSVDQISLSVNGMEAYEVTHYPDRKWDSVTIGRRDTQKRFTTDTRDGMLLLQWPWRNYWTDYSVLFLPKDRNWAVLFTCVVPETDWNSQIISLIEELVDFNIWKSNQEATVLDRSKYWQDGPESLNTRAVRFVVDTIAIDDS